MSGPITDATNVAVSGREILATMSRLGGERRPKELATICGICPQWTARQLRILLRRGIVLARGNGNTLRYRLAPTSSAEEPPQFP